MSPACCNDLADYVDGFANTRGTCFLAGSSKLLNAPDTFGPELAFHNYLRLLSGRPEGDVLSRIREHNGPQYKPRPRRGVYGASSVPTTTTTTTTTTSALPTENTFTFDTPPEPTLREQETPLVPPEGHADMTEAWCAHFGNITECNEEEDIMPGCSTVTRMASLMDVWVTTERRCGVGKVLDAMQMNTMEEGSVPEDGTWWEPRSIPDRWMPNTLSAMSLKALLSHGGNAVVGTKEAADQIRSFSLASERDAYVSGGPREGFVLSHPSSNIHLNDRFLAASKNALFGFDKSKRDLAWRLQGTTSKCDVHEYVSYVISLQKLVDTTDYSKEKRSSALSRLRRDLTAALDEEGWARVKNMPGFSLQAFTLARVAMEERKTANEAESDKDGYISDPVPSRKRRRVA